MGAVLLTGATGFVGGEILDRLLEQHEGTVYALVRAENDETAAARLKPHARLRVLAGDIEEPGLGLDPAAADELCTELTTVIHCAASVSFGMELAAQRRINVDGTRHVVELAERCERLERLTYISTAYVSGEPRGVFREDQLDVGQSFRNPYERSKFEAERMIRERAAGLPLQILRPSIVVGDSRTGRTSAFNVLYGPLKAFARGRIPAIPARRSSPVDIVPVDYVADRVVELAMGGPDGTFHLVAGRNATTVDRLLDLDLDPPRPRPANACCRRGFTGGCCIRGCGESTVACAAWRSTSRTSRCGSASTTACWVQGLPSRATSAACIEFAERARWGVQPT